MSMPRDRLTWIVVPIAAIGLILTIYWQQQQAAKVRAEAYANQPIPSPQASATPANTPLAVTAQPSPTPAQPAIPEQSASLKSDVAKLDFSNLRGGLTQVELLKYKGEDDRPVILNSDRAPAIGAITRNPSDWRDSGYALSDDQTSNSVTLTKDFGDNIQVVKTYTVGKSADVQDPFQLKLAIEFKNTGSAAVDVPGFFVSTGAAQPIHALDRSTYTTFGWDRDSKYQQVSVDWFGPSNFLFFFQTSAGHDIYSETGSQISWAAVTDQYFTTIVQSKDKSAGQVWAKRAPVSDDPNQRTAWSIDGALGFPGFNLQPGETKVKEFVVYTGPKEYNRLSKLDDDLNSVLNFGWPFGPISAGLLIMMNTIHAFIPNYGLAIILMTIIIRGLVWPIQNTSMKSMRKMAKLSPLVNELKVKYKDDQQRMNQEMMKLYKEYNINPLTGCLPMFIQIPIFFAFYAMLGSSVELRDSSFLWVHDLSQPDTIAHIFGFPLNIIPLVSAATQVWQLQITPKTGDASQQRILLVMPVVFLFICYNFAAALSLYYTASNLFTIVQTYLTMKQTAPDLPKPVKAQAVAKKKSYR
ncbi:MAG TPA: membrane protein insertase YidC [Chthoniobacterales bacterium]|jgi:YidC/Oxa1 family membrane protein insertase